MPKQARRRITGLESIEAKSVGDEFKGIGKDVMDSWKDFLGGSIGDATEQVFGTELKRGNGDLSEGEAISLKEAQSESRRAQETAQRTEVHLEYFEKIKETATSADRGEQTMVRQQIEQIRVELQSIKSTSAELEQVVKTVNMQMPVNPGRYHVNFFEWLLTSLTNARRNLESSANWLNLFKSKKQQKQYWTMAKKHGTTFSLSQERTAATQTG